MPRYEYECALSGVTAPGEVVYEKDGLDDLPAGWVKITFQRRVANPKYVLIQQVKNVMLEALVSRFPENTRQAQEAAIRLQVEAQYYVLERDTPPYYTEEESVYVSSPEESEDVAEALNEARELLGFDDGDADDEDDDEDVDVATVEPDPEPEPAPVAKPKKPKAKVEPIP